MKTIRVIHKTKVDERTGISKIVPCRRSHQTIEKIVATHIEGTVRTTSGDVWDVAPDPESKADYVSVAP